jgi:tetratricopeptide (TPR) repeat protein
MVLIGVMVAVKAKLSPGRLQSIYVLDPRDDVRLPMWGVAAEMWQKNFWWGVGPGHFNVRFVQYRPDFWRFQPHMGWVHNDYLNALVDWGLAGALLVAIAFGVFFWQVARSWRHVQRSQNDLNVRLSNRSAIVMGGTVGLIAILIHSLTDFNFQIPANAIVAVTLLALVAGHFRFASERYWHTVRWPLRIPVTLALVALIGCLAGQAWRGTREGLLLKASRRAVFASKQYNDLLKEAFSVENKNWETAYRLGESLRLLSFQVPPGFKVIADKQVPWFQALAEESLPWFAASARLNRFDPLPLLKAGMSLDWLGRHSEAGEMFRRAHEIDPTGYYTRALNGWHCFQIGEYQKARAWFQESLKVWRKDNPIATAYLKLIDDKLASKSPLH